MVLFLRISSSFKEPSDVYLGGICEIWQPFITGFSIEGPLNWADSLLTDLDIFGLYFNLDLLDLAARRADLLRDAAIQDLSLRRRVLVDQIRLV